MPCGRWVLHLKLESKQYQLTEALDISGGIRYTWLGDATAEVSDSVVGEFRNNDVVSFGLKLGVRF